MADLELEKRATNQDSPRVVVYRLRRGNSKGKKKKQSRGLRVIERTIDQIARANESFWTTYHSKHDLSNREKRDGWLRDLNDNIYRAARNANKRVDLVRIVER